MSLILVRENNRRRSEWKEEGERRRREWKRVQGEGSIATNEGREERGSRGKRKRETEVGNKKKKKEGEKLE